MDKKDLAGYLEFSSRLVSTNVEADLQALVRAADESAIHTFGWPVAPVLHNEEFKPRAYTQDSIRAVIDARGRFDYWTLDRRGNYFILESLFEDQRGVGKIYLDTRIVRTAEVLLRTARLYRSLGLPLHESMSCRLEYGGLRGRELTAANQLRAFTLLPRKCDLDVVVKDFQGPIESFQDPEHLKMMVFNVTKAITEACEFFVPSKAEVIDPIVDAFIAGRVI